MLVLLLQNHGWFFLGALPRTRAPPLLPGELLRNSLSATRLETVDEGEREARGSGVNFSWRS